MGKQAPLVKDRHGDFWWVDTRRLIEEEGFNRREAYGDIPKLAKEIKAAGLENLEPLLCYKKGECWVVLRGYRRTRALKILEQEGNILMVRIIPAPKGFKKEDMILDQITGNEGTPFTPWEQAKVLRDLRSLGWSEDDIIKRSGKSDVYVRRLLSLADAPQKLINLVREGKVKATLAMEEIAEDKALEKKGEMPVKVAELIEKAEKNQLSPVDPELELYPEQANKPARTTKSDLQKPASFKKVGKWIADVDDKSLAPEKREALKLIRRWLEGTLTEEFMKKYLR